MIRSATINDVPAILDIYAPFIRDTAVSFEQQVPDEHEMWDRISDVMKTLPWLVCEIEGRVVGYAYSSAHRFRASYQWTKEVSVYVHPNYRKRKVAHMLYTALIRILELQGVCNLLAGLTVPNEPSRRFHEHMGFTEVGTYHGIGHKFGEWHDVMWMEKRLSFDNSNPFRPIQELDESMILSCLAATTR